MKAIRSMGSGVMFEVEGNTQVELFTGLADIDKAEEVFGEWQCGCCQNKHIVFSYRDVEYQERDKKTGELLFITSGKNKGEKKMTTSRYFEMTCKNSKCRARKSFGQMREGGGLFPKNKTPDGKDYLPNFGWKVFVKPTDGNEAPNDGGAEDNAQPDEVEPAAPTNKKGIPF